MKNKKIGLVIVAGGSGQRMGSDCPKQYLKICGREIILHTLDVFVKLGIFSGISVVCHGDYLEFCRELINANYPGCGIIVTTGGATRQQSVFCGLKSLQNCDCVLIHDAVRCCVSAGDVTELCKYLTGPGACALGVKVKDTVKIADEHNDIVSTPDRKYLWQIQTPQAFVFDDIYNAHIRAIEDEFETTDDCALIEAYGGKVHIVEGSYENIKITTPSDMDIAAMFLKKRLM